MNIREKVFGQTGLAESPLVRVKNPKGARADELLSIPVVREIGRSADSRLEDRFPLTAEMTRVSRGSEAHAVQLVNVCGGGAMIAAPFEPLQGRQRPLFGIGGPRNREVHRRIVLPWQ